MSEPQVAVTLTRTLEYTFEGDLSEVAKATGIGVRKLRDVICRGADWPDANDLNVKWRLGEETSEDITIESIEEV